VKYDHDDEVTTKDGKRHRVLWQTKRDADGNQLELRVKSLDDKHRGAYTIKCSNITEHAPRPHKVYE
jgi:hypothetical protein